MTVEIKTLGALRVIVDGHDVPKISSQKKNVAVLVYLATEGARTRDTLLSVFWPDKPADKARHALNQTLHELRRVIPGSWLRTDGDTIQVDDEVVTDVATFEDLARDGRSGDALKLYGGPFLEGHSLVSSAEFEAWVDGIQGRMERMYGDAVGAWSDELVAAGDIAEAISQAEVWVGRQPFEDDGHARLIELLARAGRRRDALRRFEQYRELLREDEMEPTEDILDLVDRIRGGRLAATKRRSAAPTTGSAQRRVTTTAPLGARSPVGPRLVRLVDGKEAEAYRLAGGRVLIGRTDGDLTFPDDQEISTLHACIQLQSDPTGAARFFIRDAGSRGGVFLRTTGDYPLRDEDEFVVGRTVFRYRRRAVDDAPSSRNKRAPN